MKKLRLMLAVTSAILLMLGYLASVQASLFGNPADYAAKVDAAPIRLLALALLVSACVLALIPDRGDTD